jgi:endonuclease YncB( thermonuclease family)
MSEEQRRAYAARKTAIAAKAAVAESGTTAPTNPNGTLGGNGLSGKGEQPAVASVYRAKVVEVVDGQTLVVEQGDQKHRLRLWGVFVPRNQKVASDQARDFVKNALDGQLVRVEERGQENGQALALVTAENAPSNQPRPSRGTDSTGIARDLPYTGRANPAPLPADTPQFPSINEAIIRAGRALVAPTLPQDTPEAKTLREAQNEARERQAGVWERDKRMLGRPGAPGHP